MAARRDAGDGDDAIWATPEGTWLAPAKDEQHLADTALHGLRIPPGNAVVQRSGCAFEEQRARSTAPRSSRYAIGSSSEPEESGTVEHVGWNRTDHSVVVWWIVAPAIGFRYADNAHLVGTISRCGQTRHRARSTRDRTWLTADQEDLRSRPLVGARAIRRPLVSLVSALNGSRRRGEGRPALEI